MGDHKGIEKPTSLIITTIGHFKGKSLDSTIIVNLHTKRLLLVPLLSPPLDNLMEQWQTLLSLFIYTERYYDVIAKRSGWKKNQGPQKDPHDLEILEEDQLEAGVGWK